MGNNFKKLKTKYFLTAVLQSAVAGISCGLFAVGAVLLALKLCLIEISFAYYILIGVGTALLAGAGLFLFLYKFRLSDKKIAANLDKKYGLNERVQTAVAFKEEQGEIVTVLKEDTEDVLGNLPEFSFGFKKFAKKFWYFAVIIVLALALFITALCIPAQNRTVVIDPPPVEEDPDPDPLYIYDLDAQSKLYGLRRDIMNSNLEESEKSAFDKVLEDLDALLAKTVTGEVEIRTSELAILITTAVYAIDGITDSANSFRKISEAVAEVDENLSKAVTEGVILYKSFSYSLVDMDMVKGLYTRVNSNVDDTVEKYFNASYEDYKYDESVNEPVTDGTVISGLRSKLETALQNSQVSADDGLYTVFDDFATKGLQNVLDKVGNGYYAAAMNETLKIVYDGFKTSVTSATLVQTYNCIMDVYVRQKLAEIFGVSINGLGGLYDDLIPEGGDANNGDNNEGGDGSNNGGFGYGDDIYGSKDLIYDPDVYGGQVEYGKVYADYYNKVDERLRDDDLPKDIADFIAEYFKILQNGTKDDSSEDN